MNQTVNEKDFPKNYTKDPGHAYPFMYIHYVAVSYDVRKSPHTETLKCNPVGLSLCALIKIK